MLSTLRRTLAATLAVLAGTAAAALSPVAFAADGDLDSGFGAAGARIDQFALAGTYGSFAQDLALRADGRPVAVVFATGADGVTRLTTVQYTTAGGLDPGFATGGVHRVGAAPVPTDSSFSSSVAVLSDDRVLSGGNAGPDTLESPVLQLDSAAGALDPTFGPPPGGLFFPPLSAGGTPGDVRALTPIAGAGAIAVGATDASGGRAFIAKLLPNGTLDPAFNATGLRLDAIDPTAGNRNAWSSVAIAPGGKIVVASETNDTAPGGLVAVVGRFTATGAPDTTFGPAGLRYIQASPLTDDSRKTVADGVAVLPDGRIVVGLTIAYKHTGPTVDDNAFRLGAARLNTDGTLDPSFGSGGIVQVQAGEAAPGADPNSSMRGLVVQPSGRIILGGAADDLATGRSQLVLVRLTAAGAPDPTFGSAGVRRHALGGTTAASQAIRLALTPGQLLYAAGSVGDKTLLARFLAGTPPVPAITGPTAPTAGTSVTFDASGSKASDGGPLTFDWDLNGDGVRGEGTGAGASASYAAGAHTVSVLVTDDNGLSATASFGFTAIAPPKPPKAPKASLPATASVKNGVARLRIGCARGSVACAGTVTLYGAGRLPATAAARRKAAPVYGRKKFSIPAGRTRTVRTTLSRAGRKAFARRRSLRVTARAVTRRAGRTPTTVTRKVTLRRR